MAENNIACKSLTNILFKAYCVNVCDTEKQMGCLRRKEKTFLINVIQNVYIYSFNTLNDKVNKK